MESASVCIWPWLCSPDLFSHFFTFFFDSSNLNLPVALNLRDLRPSLVLVFAHTYSTPSAIPTPLRIFHRHLQLDSN